MGMSRIKTFWGSKKRLGVKRKLGSKKNVGGQNKRKGGHKKEVKTKNFQGYKREGRNGTKGLVPWFKVQKNASRHQRKLEQNLLGAKHVYSSQIRQDKPCDGFAVKG